MSCKFKLRHDSKVNWTSFQDRVGLNTSSTSTQTEWIDFWPMWRPSSRLCGSKIIWNSWHKKVNYVDEYILHDSQTFGDICKNQRAKEGIENNCGKLSAARIFIHCLKTLEHRYIKNTPNSICASFAWLSLKVESKEAEMNMNSTWPRIWFSWVWKQPLGPLASPNLGKLEGNPDGSWQCFLTLIVI